MIKRILLIVFCAATSIIICKAQTIKADNLFPVYQKNKCGYINRNGDIVVPVKFDLCSQFNDGMAGVSVSNSHGYINEKGKLIIPLKFEGFFPESFSEGLAPIKLRNKNGKSEIGYVDKSGMVSLIEGASEAGAFYEGLALVKKNMKFGFIDKSMRFVIQPEFYLVRSFADGRAWVCDQSGNEFYINKYGKKVIGDFGKKGSDFSEGLATFESKYVGAGYINTDGEIIIKPNFLYACLFNGGLACAKDYNGKWGFIDRSGNFVIQPQFDEAEDFSSDGVAPVLLNGKWGFIDKSGKFVVEPRFEKASWINGLGAVEILGRERYINNNQIFIW